MTKECSQNEGPDVELMRKYGFSDDQIKAMNGMGAMMPRGTIWRLLKRTPEEIIEKLQKEYGPAIKTEASNFTEALNNPSKFPDTVKGYTGLIRNSLRKDLKIALKLNDEELIKESLKNIRAFFEASNDPDIQLSEMLST